MIRRNRKLFSLILTASLITTYTTTSILPVEVFATEISQSQKIIKTQYSDEIINKYNLLINKLPSIKCDAKIPIQKTSNINLFFLDLTQENFYQHFKNTEDATALANSLESSLKTFLKDENLGMELHKSSDGKIIKISLISTKSRDLLNHKMAELFVNVPQISARFEKENLNTLPSTPLHLNYEEKIFMKKDNHNISIGSKIPNKTDGHISSLLNYEIIPTVDKMNIYDYGVISEDKKLLGFFINNKEYSINNLNFKDLNLNFKDFDNTKSIELKFVFKNSSSKESTGISTYTHNIEFEKSYAINKQIPSLNTSITTEGKNQILNYSISRASDTLKNSHVFLEVTLKDGKQELIDYQTLNPNKIVFNKTFSQEIKSVKVYGYDQNFFIKQAPVNLPLNSPEVTFSDSDILFVGDVRVVPIKNFSPSNEIQYYIGDSNIPNPTINTPNLIPVIDGNKLDFQKIKNLVSRTSNLKLFGFNKTNSLVETFSFNAKLHTTKFSCSITDNSKNIKFKEKQAYINKQIVKPNFIIMLNSSHYLLSESTVTIESMNGTQISKKNLSINTLEDKEYYANFNIDELKQGNYRIKIECKSSSGENFQDEYNLLYDVSAPELIEVPNSGNHIFSAGKEIEAWFLDSKSNGKIDFNVSDNLELEPIKSTRSHNSVELINDTLSFNIKDINKIVNFPVKIFDRAGNYIEKDFKFIMDTQPPKINTFTVLNDSIGHTTQTPNKTYLYANQAAKNVEINATLSDNTFIDKINSTKSTLDKTFSIDIDQSANHSEISHSLSLADFVGNSLDHEFIVVKNTTHIKNENNPYLTDAIDLFIRNTDTKVETPLCNILDEKTNVNYNAELVVKKKTLKATLSKIELAINDGNTQTLQFDSNSELTLPLTDGINKINYNVLSSNGTSVSNTINLVIDTEKPTFEFSPLTGILTDTTLPSDKFYINKNSNSAKFNLSVQDNNEINIDNIQLFLDNTLLNQSSDYSIKSTSVNNNIYKFEIEILKLDKPIDTNLKVLIKDIASNPKSSEYSLIKTDTNIKNPNSELGTDFIDIKINTKSYTDYTADYKPNSNNIKNPTLELTENFNNKPIPITFSKTNALKDPDLLKVYYTINASSIHDSAVLGFNSTASNTTPVTLKKGVNTISYVTKLSNNESHDATLNLNYDPDAIKIESNLKDLNSVKEITPEFTITDPNISEIDSICIINNGRTIKTLNHEYLEKTAKKNETETIYKLTLDSLPEGEYKNFKIKINSNFGKRRSMDISQTFNFKVDKTLPEISSTPVNSSDFVHIDENNLIFKYSDNANYKVKYSIDDNFDVSELKIEENSLSGATVRLDTKNKLLIIEDLTEGANLLTLNLTDAAGNLKPKAVNVYLQHNPADIKISSTLGNNIYTEKNTFYTPNKTNTLKFNISTNDIAFDEPNLGGFDKNNLYYSINDSEYIQFTKAEKAANDNYDLTLDTKTNGVQNIKIKLVEFTGHTTIQEFKVITNHLDLANSNSVYGTDFIKIKLDDTYFESFSHLDKPQNSKPGTAGYKPTLQLTKGLNNDSVNLSFTKGRTIKNLKTKIDLTVNSNKNHTLNFNDTKPLNIDNLEIKKGQNIIDYKITASNGATYTDKLFINYDPDSIQVTSDLLKLKGASKDNNPNTEFEICDPNISEIDYIEFTLKHNNNSNVLKLTSQQLKNYLVQENNSFVYKLSATNGLNKLFNDYYKNGALIDGQYKITCSIKSNFGRRRASTTQTYNSNFIIDTKKPETNFVIKNNNTNKYEFIENNSFYNTDGKAYITVKKEDFSSDLKSLSLKINDHTFTESDITKLACENNDYSIFSINLKDFDLSEDKKYNIELNAIDKADNISKLTKSYTVDRKLPKSEAIAIDINADNADVILNANPKNLNSKKLKFTSTDTNLKEQKITIYQNGKFITQISSKKSLEDNLVNFYNLSKEGNYKFVVESIDLAGNTQNSTFKLNADLFAPQIDLKGYSNKLFADNNTFKIGIGQASNDIQISDSMKSIDKIKLVVTEINNPTNKKNYELNNLDYNSFKEVLNENKEGAYTVEVIATDLARNEKSIKGSFIVDKTAPVISINAPEINFSSTKNGNYDAGHHQVTSVAPIVKIKDVSSKSEDLKFFINDERIYPSLISNQNYELQYQLPKLTHEKIYTLRVEAKDQVITQNIDTRKASSSQLEFAIDNTAPDLKVNIGNKSITSGSIENYLTNHSSSINSSAADKISLKDEIRIKTIVKKNGSPISFNNKFTFTADDNYTVEIIATDKAGNSTKFIADLTVDTIFPEITLSGINNNHHYNKNVTPKWKVDDKEAITTVMLNETSLNSPKEISNEGTYTFTVRSIDKAGNTSVETLKFTIDKTKPVIKIEGVENNKTYTTNVAPKLIYDKSENLIITSLLNNLDFISGTTIDSDGNYSLLVKATDQAGNASEYNLKFRLNVSKPVIEVLNVVNNKTYYEPLSIDVKFKDTVDYTITVNGKPYHGEKLSEIGNYDVVITAFDEDKNKSVEELSFRIDDKKNNTSSIKSPSITSKDSGNINKKLIIFSLSGILAIFLILLFTKKKKNN